MRGYAFDPAARKLTFFGTDGREPLVVPDAVPVLLLQTEVSFTSQDAEYPDVAKDRIFVHTWNIDYNGLVSPPYFASEIGICVVSALPGEWSQSTALADAPAGANFFLSQVRLNRIVAPSHAWLSETIVAKPPANKWLSLVTGSILLEAVQGFSRAVSIYVDVEPGSPTEGKLVLHQQQSVADAPGGFGNHPGTPGGEPSGVSKGSWNNPDYRNGGETLAGTTAGHPVYQGPNSAPQYRSRGFATSGGAISIDVPRDYRKSGSNPPSITDPTDYGATWRLDIRGRFGRIFEA